jgi:hypothetical protein
MSHQHSSYAAEFGDVELVPGTLRGYRGWRWNENIQRLVSTGWLHDWEQERLQPDAMCLRSDAEARRIHAVFSVELVHLAVGSRAPASECTCGFYASYAPRVYIDHASLYSGSYLHGTVSAHGAIVLGTQGFRAQRVELDALWGRTSEVAAEVYGVPWFQSERQMLQEFPPSNVDELLRQKGVEPRHPPLYFKFI